jgi:hypothetical protein
MNRLRPLTLVLAGIPYYFTQDVVRSFELLNYAFVFIEAYLIAKLGDLYGLGRFAKACLVVSLALCISTARMFAYYPMLIDLGGYVFLTLSVYAVLVAPRPIAAVAVCLAVLTREFGRPLRSLVCTAICDGDQVFGGRRLPMHPQWFWLFCCDIWRLLE